MIRTKLTGDASYKDKVSSLSDKIVYLYENRNDFGIRGLVKNQPINLLVEALESLDDIKIILRFIVVSYRIKMGELFLSFTEANKLRILEEIKAGVLVHLLNDLNSDDVYELFTISPTKIQKKIIFNASKDLKAEIKQLKSFDFAQVGSIMNTTFITLLEGMSIGEAINYLRIKKEDFDIGEEVYVTNANDEVTGKVQTNNLLFSDRRQVIEDISSRDYFSVMVEDDIDEVIDLFKKYNASSVAVINQDEKIVGIINYQDVIPEILDSNIEDLYKFYGIRDTRKSYMGSSVMDIVKSRIICLIIMLMAATFTTFVIDKFETMGVQWTAGISSAILVPIIPIITDMCGNTGSQSTATVIQAVSSGEVRYTDFWKVVRKEIKVAIVIGAILAACNFFRLVFYFALFPVDSSKFHQGAAAAATIHTSGLYYFDFPFLNALNNLSQINNKINLYKIGMVGSLASSLSLFLVVIFSKFFGVLIPFIAIKFDYDPASVSAPILTTILDTVSSIIFFGIGVVLLYAAIKPIFKVTVSQGKLTTHAQVMEASRYIFLLEHS